MPSQHVEKKSESNPSAEGQQNLISVVLGRKGSGKTTLVKELINQERKARGRVVIIDPCAEFSDALLLRLSNREDVDYFTNNERFYVRFVPTGEDEYIAIMQIVYLRGDLLVVVEESGIWQTPSQIDNVTLNCLRLGRHRKLDQLYVARRPSELNRMVTAMADRFYVFSTTEPRDLEYVRKMISNSVAERLPMLPRFTFVSYAVPDLTATGKTKKPR